MTTQPSLKIAFVHPDLGIGGAEQLVVNFAVALKNKGHRVKIFTPYHDHKHCFPETINGTIDVEVHGGWFPNEILRKFTAFCAVIRMIICSLWIIFYGGKYDLIIVDQVSACVPLFRLSGRKVLFYCHFPDKLLCVDRRSIFKRVYRFFLDYIEEITTYFAHMILVNSLFTKDIFHKSFKLLKALNVNPEVLYPAIDFSKFDNVPQDKEFMSKVLKPFFLSLNRYERKKDIGLAIKAMAQLKKINPQCKHKLIIAGGYDSRVRENVEHWDELNKLAVESGLKIEEDIQFMKNLTDVQRANLLRDATAVLYTPQNEHFGIVPTEAMYMNAPVIACKSGGPKESVLDEKTGFLLQPDPKEWAEKMNVLATNEKLRVEMGVAGRKNSKDRFGLEAFANSANEHSLNVVLKRKAKTN
jgi:alpha-1,3/alpha-1,6-mannosyltransferase